MGIYRSEPDKAKSLFSKTHQHIQFAVAHMCGWRLYMEDTSIEQFDFDGQNHHIFGIFDGHGGGQVSAFVKKHFAKELINNIKYTEKNYQKALEQTFQKMDQLLKTEAGIKEIRQIQNQLILQDNLPKRDEKKNTAGCTALVCLLAERLFFVSNAGDSRAYAKKDGKFISLNRLHSPNIEEQHQRIINAGGIINQQDRINGSLNVSRGIGDFQFKSSKKLPSRKQMVISFPDIKKQSLEGVEYILMGCDGIWQEKSPKEIHQFIDLKINQKKSSEQTLKQMLDWLICKQQDAQNKQFGKDNMTAILIKFKPYQATFLSNVNQNSSSYYTN